MNRIVMRRLSWSLIVAAALGGSTVLAASRALEPTQDEIQRRIGEIAPEHLDPRVEFIAEPSFVEQ